MCSIGDCDDVLAIDFCSEIYECVLVSSVCDIIVGTSHVVKTLLGDVSFLLKTVSLSRLNREVSRHPNLFFLLLSGVQSLLSQLDDATYLTLTINFSSASSAPSTQAMIEQKLEKRQRSNYGPLHGKARLLLFIDDLNMPKKDRFG